MASIEERIIANLSTLAQTSYNGKPSTEREVVLLRPYRPTDKHIVLMIRGTPGQWNLGDLGGWDTWNGKREASANRLAIDYGQGWYVENLHALVDESMRILERLVLKKYGGF